MSEIYSEMQFSASTGKQADHWILMMVSVSFAAVLVWVRGGVKNLSIGGIFIKFVVDAPVGNILAVFKRTTAVVSRVNFNEIYVNKTCVSWQQFTTIR